MEATMTVGEMCLEDAAHEAAGNWKSFSSFAWFRRHKNPDPENWAIIYTHNRDSGLLALSNADAIADAMMPFSEADDPDVVFETHDHFAVGHVDGFSIRVSRDGAITEAFRTYYELAERLAEYPVLDEEDYSRREYEATLENIADAAWRLKRAFELPEGWESAVFSWFWDHRQRAVENRDDQGGYPTEEDLRDAFEALGYEQID
jgi:hypothetical protein